MASETQKQQLCDWVEEHSDYLFRCALKHFPDTSAAEEIVQETFVAAVGSIANFKGDSSPRTWLTSILRFKVIDRIRAKTRDNSVSLDEVKDPSLSHYFDEAEHWKSETGPVHWNTQPDALLEQKQLRGILEQCVTKLPERFRNIFLLRELEGLSRDEIAEQLRLSASNIGVILHRARLALRDCLQVHWLADRSS